MKEFSAFASPLEGDFVSLSTELIGLHVRLICKKLSSISQSLGKEDDLLLARVRAAADSADPVCQWFSPEIGLVYEALSRTGVTTENWSGLCAQLAIGLFMSGSLDELDFSIESAIPLYLSGVRVDPQRVVLQARGQEIKVYNSGNKLLLRLVGHMQADAPTVWVAENSAMYPLRLGSASQCLLAEQYSAWQLGGQRDHTVLKSVKDAESQFVAALDALEAFAPEFYLWVILFLRYLTPVVRRGPSSIGSASNFYLPGVLQVTSPASIGETVEMLVHECSHQYFGLAMRFGSFERPNAPKSLSPLTKSERPLNRILTGYHAFGNTQLVYKRLAQNDASLLLPERRATVWAGMSELEAILEQHAAAYLTEMGSLFYDPLRSRLLQENVAAV